VISIEPLLFVLLAQQAAPAVGAADPPAGEEIVVHARYGFLTMLFDRGDDGKLRNCRVLVSSGSRRRDARACDLAPQCYEAEAEQKAECAPLVTGASPPASTGTRKPSSEPR